MKTEGEITAYIANLDEKGAELEAEVLQCQQVHQLQHNECHEENCILAMRRLVAVRAKSIALGWVLKPSDIPED